MSATPPTSAQGNTKPSLTGVRIKQRKGAAKAAAKFEPEVFRDALLAHLLPIPPTQYDLIATKLITAGSTLELLKYSDALFEIVLVGGLLQPGGSYLDDEKTERSPFAIIGGKDEIDGSAIQAGEDGKFDAKEVREEVNKKTEVLKKVIQRYKYLQKPLETSTLPSLLQYLLKFTPIQREKLADLTANLIANGLASGECLEGLTKEHIVKDGVSLAFFCSFLKAYLSIQSIEHLSRLLKSSFKDLIDVFPQGKKTRSALDAHFRAEGLVQVADWYGKRQTVLVKEELSRWMAQACDEEEFNEEWKENTIGHLAIQQVDNALPTLDIVTISWSSLMSTFEWSGRNDQLAKVKAFLPVLESFCKKPMDQVNLINIVQVYCYDEQKMMKSFPSLVRLLWEADLVSDNAFVYWFDKGAKPQGKELFLKSVQALYDHITSSDDEDDE